MLGECDNLDNQIDYSMPSYYRDLISLIANEIYAIRDAVDPPIGKKYHKELRKIKNSLKNNDDLQERILCSDGNCIGVINNDGYCNECGKPNSNKK